MPSLIKKRGSDVWFVRLQPHGKDRLRSTGATNRRLAVKQLKAAEAEARLERTVDSRMDDLLAQPGRRPEKQREELRLRLIGWLEQLAMRRLPLTEAWAARLAVPKQTGAATLAGYDAAWKRFKGWLAANRPAVARLSQVGESEARE